MARVVDLEIVMSQFDIDQDLFMREKRWTNAMAAIAIEKSLK
jgi:hypothetical protein